MEAVMAILGVKTMDDAIEAMRHLPITAIPIMPLCYEHPFEFAEPVAPVKKSVRFVDEVKEEVLTSDRSENKNPKEYSPYDPDDFPEWMCKNGGYIEGTGERMELVGNIHFNSGPKVNDKSLLNTTRISNACEKNASIYKNYMEAPNPVKYVSSHILTGGIGIVQHLPQEFLIDCITYMMGIYEDLEPMGTTIVVDYQGGVTISNKPGKKQRSFIKKKIEYLTNQLE
jgi:hypothetical protein